MRKSREEAARTRERIIAAAAEEFREHGVVATGLADLMKAAGLTHGGFYKHFASKDELVREVTAATVDKTTSLIRQAGEKRPGRKGLVDAVATYLSPEHRDNPGQGCAACLVRPGAWAGRGQDAGRGDRRLPQVRRHARGARRGDTAGPGEETGDRRGGHHDWGDDDGKDGQGPGALRHDPQVVCRSSRPIL